MTINMRLYSKKEIGIIVRIVIFGILLSSAYVIFDYITDGYYTEYIFGEVVFDFYHFLPFILGATLGLVPGVTSFVIVFIWAYISYGMDSFSIFGYLLIYIVSDLLSKYGAFANKKRVLATAGCMSFLSTNVWMFILRILEGDAFNISAKQEFLYFIRELPQYIIAGFIIYILLNVLNENMRKYVIYSYYYGEDYRNEKRRKGLFSSYNKLSRRVTVALFIDLVLIMTATTIFLFPSDYLNYYFSAGREQYVFYAKHVMLLLNALLPCVIIANHMVQRITIDEIRNLSDYLGGLSEVGDEQRKEYIKKIERIRPVTNDEVSELYEAMKNMVYEEEAYFDQIRKDDYVEDDLKIAQAADNAKNSFLSNMTHEIRTPINAILGMDEMILREGKEPRVLGYAKNIRIAGDKLLILVNNILDFSKIESGKMEVISAEYSVENFVKQLVNTVAYDIRLKNLELNIYVNPNIPSVLSGDGNKIRQAAHNLMDNAIKYTTEGGVTLSIDYEESQDETIMLSVVIEDTGTGIKQEDLEKLFKPFERIDENRNRAIQGTGIGIALTSQLLRLMHSSLNIDSTYGKGTRASFSVRQKIMSKKPTGDFVKDINIDEIYYEKENYVAPEARILVVDDTELNIYVMKELLKRSLVKVDMAKSGKEAVLMAEKAEYDIIFIDYRMPVMNGEETLNEIKKKIPDAATRYVVCTASDESYRNHYREKGFDEYISKPVDSSILDNLIFKLLPSEKIKAYEV